MDGQTFGSWLVRACIVATCKN